MINLSKPATGANHRRQVFLLPTEKGGGNTMKHYKIHLGELPETPTADPFPLSHSIGGCHSVTLSLGAPRKGHENQCDRGEMLRSRCQKEIRGETSGPSISSARPLIASSGISCTERPMQSLFIRRNPWAADPHRCGRNGRRPGPWAADPHRSGRIRRKPGPKAADRL